MTWQDEQRQLDAELSAGRISSEDYQRRRYELMYRYGGEEAGAAGDQPDQSASPFPPAFRWEAALPQSDQSDASTELFPRLSEDDTQVVSRQPVDAERTQVVRDNQRDPAPPPTYSAPSPTQQPTSGAVPPERDPFQPEQRSGSTHVVPIVAAIVVVVLLAVGGLGAYLLLAPDSTSQADQRPAVQPPPPAREQGPPAPQPGTQLPDPARIGGDGRTRVVPTFEELRAAEVVTPEGYAALEAAGATSSKLLVSSFEDGPRATVLVTRVRSAGAAVRARDELAQLQRAAGFQEAGAPDPGLKSFYLVDDPQIDPTVRGFYHNGDVLVRLEVVGPERLTTARRYDTIVQQQLATLPADG